MTTKEFIKNIKKFRKNALSRTEEKVLFDFVGDGMVAYLKKPNYLYDVSDIQQEYWIGVVVALSRADLRKNKTVLSYVRQYGMYYAKNFLRSTYRKKLVGVCECGKTFIFGNKSHVCECGNSIDIVQRENHDEFIDMAPNLEDIYERINNTIDFENAILSVKGQLSEKQLEVFRAFESGDAFDYNNYCEELSKRMGCSKVAVAIKVRKIRKKFSEILNSNI